jgi:membrane peptidoglycan carboxypeptidase
LSPQAAFVVSDILADPAARATGFGSGGPLATPYPSSVKTGTSKNFRDNWCVGFTSGHVVAVWAGNFQARPMLRVSGITGAGHLWRQVSDLLAGSRPPAPRRIPPGVSLLAFCPVSGLPAGPDCPNTKTEWVVDSAPSPPRCSHRHFRPGVLEALRAAVPGAGKEAAGMDDALIGGAGTHAAGMDDASIRGAGTRPAAMDAAGPRAAGPGIAAGPEESGGFAPAGRLPGGPAAAGGGAPFVRAAPASQARPAPPGAVGRNLPFGLLSPAVGEVLALDPDLPPAFQRLRAVGQSEPGVDELVFVLNGAEIGRREVSGHQRASAWVELSPGPQTLELQAWSGGRMARSDRVRYTVR